MQPVAIQMDAVVRLNDKGAVPAIVVELSMQIQHFKTCEISNNGLILIVEIPQSESVS
jgi:hypothetical protein